MKVQVREVAVGNETTTTKKKKKKHDEKDAQKTERAKKEKKCNKFQTTYLHSNIDSINITYGTHHS